MAELLQPPAAVLMSTDTTGRGPLGDWSDSSAQDVLSGIVPDSTVETLLQGGMRHVSCFRGSVLTQAVHRASVSMISRSRVDEPPSGQDVARDLELSLDDEELDDIPQSSDEGPCDPGEEWAGRAGELSGTADARRVGVLGGGSGGPDGECSVGGEGAVVLQHGKSALSTNLSLMLPQQIQGSYMSIHSTSAQQNSAASEDERAMLGLASFKARLSNALCHRHQQQQQQQQQQVQCAGGASRERKQQLHTNTLFSAHSQGGNERNCPNGQQQLGAHGNADQQTSPLSYTVPPPLPMATPRTRPPLMSVTGITSSSAVNLAMDLFHQPHRTSAPTSISAAAARAFHFHHQQQQDAVGLDKMPSVHGAPSEGRLLRTSHGLPRAQTGKDGRGRADLPQKGQEPRPSWLGAPGPGSSAGPDPDSGHAVAASGPALRVWDRALAGLRDKAMRMRLSGKAFADVVRRKPWVLLVPLLLCGLLCALGVFGIVYAAGRIVRSQKAYAEEAVAAATANAVASQLEIATFAVATLNAYLTQQPYCSDLNRTFHNLSATILSSDDKGLVYQLQALPAALLNYIYPPVTGQLAEQLYGRDLLQVPMYRNDTLFQISHRNKLLLGPYNLLEGFQGLFVTMPVFLSASNEDYDWGCNAQPYECPPGLCWVPSKGEKLWGLVTSVLSLDNMQADFRFQSLTSQGYLYSLRQQPDMVNRAAVISGTQTPPADPVVATISKFNLVWLLEVSPSAGWDPVWRNPCIAAVVVGSVVVSLLVLWLLVTQEKHNRLLRAMLPRKIILRLQRGEQTVVEEFMEPVTILFSDIVSYTEVASQLSPLEVVRLLNEIYTRFDALCDKHGVYKVETIGDAFMCVSGCPIREDPVRAAVRMVGMAQDMIAMVDKFSTKVGNEEMQVKIRIGLHSGPVVAGVIGQRMPRYCLFGDTVNTASRMETNSSPMRIHISAATAALLRKGGATIILPPRGTAAAALSPRGPRPGAEPQRRSATRQSQGCISGDSRPPAAAGAAQPSQLSTGAGRSATGGENATSTSPVNLSLILDQNDLCDAVPLATHPAPSGAIDSAVSAGGTVYAGPPGAAGPQPAGQHRPSRAGVIVNGGAPGYQPRVLPPLPGAPAPEVLKGLLLLAPLVLYGRGRVNIKGKGSMHTFWVGTPPQPAASQPSAGLPLALQPQQPAAYPACADADQSVTPSNRDPNAILPWGDAATSGLASIGGARRAGSFLSRTVAPNGRHMPSGRHVYGAASACSSPCRYETTLPLRVASATAASAHAIATVRGKAARGRMSAAAEAEAPMPGVAGSAVAAAVTAGTGIQPAIAIAPNPSQPAVAEQLCVSFSADRPVLNAAACGPGATPDLVAPVGAKEGSEAVAPSTGCAVSRERTPVAPTEPAADRVADPRRGSISPTVSASVDNVEGVLSDGTGLERSGDDLVIPKHICGRGGVGHVPGASGGVDGCGGGGGVDSSSSSGDSGGGAVGVMSAGVVSGGAMSGQVPLQGRFISAPTGSLLGSPVAIAGETPVPLGGGTAAAGAACGTSDSGDLSCSFRIGYMLPYSDISRSGCAPSSSRGQLTFSAGQFCFQDPLPDTEDLLPDALPLSASGTRTVSSAAAGVLAAGVLAADVGPAAAAMAAGTAQSPAAVADEVLAPEAAASAGHATGLASASGGGGGGASTFKT